MLICKEYSKTHAMRLLKNWAENLEITVSMKHNTRKQEHDLLNQ